MPPYTLESFAMGQRSVSPCSPQGTLVYRGVIQTALANCGGNCICSLFFKYVHYICDPSTARCVQALLKIIGLQWSQTCSFQLLPYPCSEVRSLGDINHKEINFFVDFLKSIKKHLRNVTVMLQLISNIKTETSNGLLLDWEAKEH